MKQINIAFCVSNNFIPYIQVTMQSIINNHSNIFINFHIVTDKITRKNVKLIKHFNINNKSKIFIYIIDDSDIIDLETSIWTKYAWYRILLPSLLPLNIKRVLYLDTDTIVNSDISNLFEIDMKGKSIAAVPDIISFRKDNVNKRLNININNTYICSGVLLINLDYWRKYEITNKIIDWAKKNRDKMIFPDQDSINCICGDTKIILHLKYGILQSFFTEYELFDQNYLLQLKESIEKPCIIHYAGFPPWIKDSPQHFFINKWVYYNKLLRKPIKRYYTSKGLTFIKVIIWDLLHPNHERILF